MVDLEDVVEPDDEYFLKHDNDGTFVDPEWSGDEEVLIDPEDEYPREED